MKTVRKNRDASPSLARQAFRQRPILSFFAVLVGAVMLMSALGFCLFSAPTYRGPVSDHFDGTQFHNQPSTEHGRLGRFLRWRLTRTPGLWREWTAAPPGPPPPRRVGRGSLRVTFVNHATTLIQMDGLNILTDPMWSERASPISWLGPRRARPPGIRFEDLPPIDVVLISHNHYDHLDVPTLARLAETHRPRFFAGLGNRALLESEDIPDARDLDWWDRVDLSGDVQLTSVPVQHFSARGLCDRDKTLWTGYVIQGPAGNVYFAGDTGYGPHFEEVGQRLGPFRLALLPISAYLPRWFMRAVHISPEEAVRAHRDLNASTSMAIHFGTFRLGDDGQDQPVEELFEAMEREGVSRSEFWVLGFGEGRDVPPIREDESTQ